MASQDETAGRNGTAGQKENAAQSQADKIASAAADAARMPFDIARQVLPAKGGLPVYAGLGALAVIGLIDWPVAAAAGLGYALARVSRGQPGPQPSAPWGPATSRPAAPEPSRPAPPPPDPISGQAPGAPGTGEPGLAGTGPSGPGEPRPPGAGTPPDAARDPLSPPAPGAPTEQFPRPAPATKPEGDPLGDSARPGDEG